MWCEHFSSRKDLGQVNLKIYCKLSHLSVWLNYAKFTCFFFFLLNDKPADCKGMFRQGWSNRAFSRTVITAQCQESWPNKTSFLLFCNSQNNREIGLNADSTSLFQCCILINEFSVLLLFFLLILRGRFLSFCSYTCYTSLCTCSTNFF